MSVEKPEGGSSVKGGRACMRAILLSVNSPHPPYTLPANSATAIALNRTISAPIAAATSNHSTSSHFQLTELEPRMMADSLSTDIPTKPDDNLLVNLSTNSTNNDEEAYWEVAMQIVHIVVPVLFAIIFVVGLVGNATLIFIVLRNKQMRTKPNVLIVNLSIGDFILILFSVPFTLAIFTFSEWHFGSVICKLNEFMQTLSLGVSIFTLTALSVDRFIAIVYPLASYSSRSLTRVIVASVVIWVMSVGLALMDLVGANVSPCLHCEPQIQICTLYPKEWGEEYKKFRVLFRFFIFFAAPMIVILCLYVIIAIVLLRQSDALISQMDIKASSSSSPPSLLTAPPQLRQRSESVAMVRQIDSRKKIAKVVLSFVVIFVVCWLPRHVYVLSWHFALVEWNMTVYALKIVGFCLMFIYSAINPLALYLLNGEYRRYFHHYLFGCCYPPWRLTYTGNRRGTASDIIGLQTMATTTNASIEDLIAADKKKGAK